MSRDRTVISIAYDNGTYIGECLLEDGQPVEDGRGAFIWSNGDRYEGDFVGGSRTGTGIFEWADGRIYEGGFIDDVRTGHGKLVWADGTVYEGGFLEGLMSGDGRLGWPNGESYEGGFLEGRMDGRGIHRAADGSIIYEGDWISGCPVSRTDWDGEGCG
jgi:hypothetical protein